MSSNFERKMIRSDVVLQQARVMWARKDDQNSMFLFVCSFVIFRLNPRDPGLKTIVIQVVSSPEIKIANAHIYEYRFQMEVEKHKSRHALYKQPPWDAINNKIAFPVPKSRIGKIIFG